MFFCVMVNSLWYMNKILKALFEELTKGEVCISNRMPKHPMKKIPCACYVLFLINE